MNKYLTGWLTFFLTSSLAAASSSFDSSFYLAAAGGVSQATFNSIYQDKTDIIQQNIADTVAQEGYTTSIAAGYKKYFHHLYSLGLELSANIYTSDAVFKSGAATTAFTDTSKLRQSADVNFLSGLLVTPNIETYLKIGVSVAHVEDTLTTPVGYLPILVTHHSTKNVGGLVAGLGLRMWLNARTAVFAEYTNRQYSKIPFANFTNFTAAYTHTAKLTANTVTAGIAYTI